MSRPQCVPHASSAEPTSNGPDSPDRGWRRSAARDRMGRRSGFIRGTLRLRDEDDHRVRRGPDRSRSTGTRGPLVFLDDVVGRGKAPCRRPDARGGPTVRRGSGNRAARARRSWPRRCRGRPGRADRTAGRRGRRPARGCPGRSRAATARRRARGFPAAGRPRAPEKNVRRRRTGCACRNAIIIRMNRRKSAFRSRSDQSTQLSGLSWHQALLLPLLGAEELVAAEDHRHALGDHQGGHQVARPAACGSASTSGSSVGPSTPQFQLQLASLPSRFPSPLASLCLWL